MSDAVIARWDGFLNQIRERFVGIMNEAREGSAGLIQDPDFNPIVLGNAWTGIESRVRELRGKIDDTWRAAVEAKFEESGMPRGAIEAQREKGVALEDWIETESERARIGVYCDLSRSLIEAAKKSLADGVPCKECGAALPLAFTFRAVNVRCNHCGSVNTYEPGTNIRLIEAMGVHPLSEEAAWSEKLQLTAAERTLRRARPETIEVLRNYERAQIAYWHAYLTFRARLLPELAPAFDKDLRGKMAHWYQNMEHNGVWAKAGKVRALV